MTYQAGSAAVSITPDFRDFHKKIAKELDGLDTQFAKAGEKAGGSFADSFRARTAGLSTTVRADTTEARAKLEELTRKPWTVRVRAVADKVSGKTGTLRDLANPYALGALGGVALGPQALGLGAGLAGLGVSFGAAAADAGAFGVIAKGMFSGVTASQQNLTKAQDAYNKATTDKGRAKALAAEQKALAGLTPAEKQLATELTSLQSAWKKLDKAEQPVVGAALTPWLQTATSGMQLLDPLIQDGAGAVRLLGTEAKTALGAPFWGTFFNTLGTTGQVGLVNFGEAAGKVGDGLAHIFVAFAPDIDKIPPLVNRLAGGFDKWAKSVTDKKFDDFLSKTFSPGNLAALAKDGKSLGSLVENIAKASQDMSPLAFGGISNVLTVLGSLSPGEIEAATGLFLAIKTIGTIGSGVSAVTGILKGAKGLAGKAGSLLGLGGQEAAAAAEGTTVGTTEGESAATAFTTAFTTGAAAGMAEAAATVGAEGAAEAGTAGAAMGAAAATGFGTAFAAEAGGELSGAIAVGLVAVLAAGVAGAALGTAAGTGFNLAFAATGASGTAGKLAADIKNGAASANTWLQPAGRQTVQGYVAGFGSQQGSVTALGGKLKGWVQAGAAGSGSWLTVPGRQASQGFSDGMGSLHGEINHMAASIKGWVTGNLPEPLGWLVNAGVSVVQGLANGIAGASGIAIGAAESLAATVSATVKGALQVNSPSKVMMPLGSAVPEGLAVGMLGGAHFVQSAGSQLADVTAQSLAGIAAGRSALALQALGVPSIGSGASLPGVSSPLGGGRFQLQVSAAGNDALLQAIVQALRFGIQAGGGNVQAYLGQR